jgi:hypothetical protein
MEAVAVLRDDVLQDAAAVEAEERHVRRRRHCSHRVDAAEGREALRLARPLSVADRRTGEEEGGCTVRARTLKASIPIHTSQLECNEKATEDTLRQDLRPPKVVDSCRCTDSSPRERDKVLRVLDHPGELVNFSRELVRGIEALFCNFGIGVSCVRHEMSCSSMYFGVFPRFRLPMRVLSAL